MAFLKTKFPLIHNSNFFFRDLHYGVMAYLASRGRHAGYIRAERIAREIAERLEREGIQFRGNTVLNLRSCRWQPG